MSVTFGEVLIWLIVGGLMGSLVASITTRSKKGYGRVKNLLLGLAGALFGGLFFEALHVDLGLGDLSISFEDLIAAALGSVLLLVLLWGLRRIRARSTAS